MKRLLFVVLVLVAGCGGSGSKVGLPEKHTITGTVTLTSLDGVSSAAQDCYGTNGYDDLETGAAVVVSDEANKVIANSTLSNSTFQGDGTCVFDFSVPGIPRAKFYKIEVSHRGQVTFSYDDIAGKNWKVELSIG